MIVLDLICGFNSGPQLTCIVWFNNFNSVVLIFVLFSADFGDSSIPVFTSKEGNCFNYCGAY